MVKQPHITINLYPIIMEYFKYLEDKKVIRNRTDGLKKAICYFLDKNKKCFEAIQK